MWSALAKLTQRILEKEEQVTVLDRTKNLIKAACENDSLAIRDILGDNKYDKLNSSGSFDRKVEDIELAIQGLKDAGNQEAADFLKEKVKVHTDIEV